MPASRHAHPNRRRTTSRHARVAGLLTIAGTLGALVAGCDSEPDTHTSTSPESVPSVSSTSADAIDPDLADVGAIEQADPAEPAALAADPAPDGDYVYTVWDDLNWELSVWRPADAENAPVILMLHGGGWNAGDRLEGAKPAHARWFADHGYVVVSVSYPLALPERPTWQIAEEQIACAMTWIDQNIAEHGGDPSRIAAVGESAGGHLALQVAYRAAAGTLTSGCGGQVPAIGAVSVLYPVVDPTAMFTNDDPNLGSEGRRITTEFTGGTPEEYPDRYTAITPASHIGPDAPPTLITVGDQDRLTPATLDARLIKQLRAAGIDAGLTLVPGANHAFDADPATPEAQAWREATVAWFAGHGIAAAS